MFRSGSSLAGSVLSAAPTSAYMFEPFHANHFKYDLYNKNGNKSSVDLHHDSVDENLIVNYTTNLFNCYHVSFDIVRSYLSTICTYNFHFLFSRSGNSF